MATLYGAPEIIGNLSECSTGVQLSHLNRGAKARLLTSDGIVIIDEWPVSSAEEVFHFHPGRLVKAGMDVVAKQFDAGMEGLFSKVVHVNAPPDANNLSLGSFADVYECAECVWLFNVFAGAKIQIFTSANNEFLGEGLVNPSGTAHIDLKRQLTLNDSLYAVQSACAQFGSPVVSATPFTSGRVIPLASVPIRQATLTPVKKCGTALHFPTIMPGAFVTLTRKAVGKNPITYRPSCISISPFTLWGFEPFTAGEELILDTSFEKCKTPINTVKWGVKSDPPDQPTIAGLVCSDSPDISLTGLEIGARVEITVGSVTLIFGATKTEQHFPFSSGQVGAPKLLPGTIISVRQNLCGGPNDWSVSSQTKVIETKATVPTLTSPPHMSSLNNLAVTFKWIDPGLAPCSHATAFAFQIATDVNMSSVFYQEPQITTGPSAYVTGWLQAGNTYFWRVRAHHPNSPPSAWSNVFQFTTAASAVTGNRPNPEPESHTFYFCVTCGIKKPYTVAITAITQDEADTEMFKRTNGTSCMYSPGKCQD